MHWYNYEYIFILVHRSSSWSKGWSHYHHNGNLLIFAILKRCTISVPYCMFVLNTPNCLQDNETLKILQKKHFRFWVTCLDTSTNGAFWSLGSGWPPAPPAWGRTDVKQPCERPCQHLPSSNGLEGSPHTWQHLQDHVGSCLSLGRI